MSRPLEIPVIRFYTPDKRDKGLIELWNTEVASYVPLDEGSPYPNTREFPGYKLGKQLPLESDEKYVVRIWVTDEVGAEWFGYAIKYLGEANANPIFIRTYREPRNTYAAKTKGTALKAVYKLTVTNTGTGYTPGTFPALTFSGGAGTGAAGHAVVNSSGTIAEFVLDDGGDNYTSSPTFTVAAPPSGTTATGTALIQPATAILTTEETQEFPQDSEFYGLYLQVTRVYETLPGPYLPFTRYSEDLGPIQGRRRAVVNTGQVTTLGATSKKTYEARDGSYYVSWEIEEVWSDGTGSAGNPVYPILVEDFYDPDREAVQRTTQIVVATGSEVGSEANSGGTITKIIYEPYADNPALLKKIIETWVVPNTLRSGQNYNPTLDLIIPFTERREAAGTSLGTNRKDISPIDKLQQLTRTYDQTAIATFLNAYVTKIPDYANLDLPHVLQSITSVMSKSVGLGDGSSSGSAGATGTHGSYSLPGNDSHQASAAITAELIISIKEYWARAIPSIRYTFFMALPFTAADVLTKLTTLAGASVNTWPQFRPVTHDLLTTSRGISLQVSARTQVHYAFDATSESDASISETSYSKEVGIATQAVRISPTIHGSISVAGTTSDSQAVSGRAQTASTGTVGASADTGTISDSAAATVSPTTLSATGGTSAVPTTGLYIVPGSSHAEIFGYGFALLHFEVVDFANVT